jgi:GxxExxY protein
MLQHEGTKDTKASALALSHEIIGAAIEVHRLLGPGLLESIYEAALSRELRLRDIAVERQITLPVNYKGEVLECHVKLDLLVEGNVIVEIKALEKLMTRPQGTASNLPETSEPVVGPPHQLQC